jgi:aldose 1-epimerase
MTETDFTLTLRTPSIEVVLLTVGASIQSIRIPGIAHSLALGTPDLSVYGKANRAFLGATIGRNANRLAGGRLPVDGTVHQLSVNEAPNQLHGGITGFWARDWTVAEASDSRAVLTLHSPDGEDGYPGEAEVRAIFTVSEEGTLTIRYEGTVSRRSVLNLTSHLYFNLSGEASTRDHLLQIDTDAFLPVDAALIPTGEQKPVADTPFDFRDPRRMIDGPAMLDHNFCLNGGRTAAPRPIASLSAAGVTLDLASTERGLQIYDGTLFDGSITGLDGRGIGPHGGIAMEPQQWPDAPNQPGFPPTLVDPGEAYAHESIYRFSRS